MMQAVFHQYHTAVVEYSFKCRNPGVNLWSYIGRLKSEVNDLCKLSFTADEIEYLKSKKYFKKDFINFLSEFRLSAEGVTITAIENGEIDVKIKGTWVSKILFEVFILSLVNQIYFEEQNTEEVRAEGKRRLDKKISFIKEKNVGSEFSITDFGTRRRFDRDWHEYVVKTLKDGLPNNFNGTSNVYLAKKFDLPVVGTMAHEWLQAFQGLDGRLVDFQKAALESWAKEYRGELGIALTDVVGIDAFLRDFDLYFCKLYDGVRHDSGNPHEWSEKMLAHYAGMNVDAKQKSFVFSDGLDVETSWALFEQCKGRVKTFFGIGTNLTNDLGVKPLNVVLKMVECNGQPVAKVSDSNGKEMCKDADYIKHLKNVFKIKN